MQIKSLFGLDLINLNILFTTRLLIAMFFAKICFLFSSMYLCQTVSLDIMMLDNLVPLDLAISNLLRLFEVVMLLLLSKEALNLMVFKSESLSSNLWQVMDETNHCLRAIWIKLVIVSSFDLRPLVYAFLRGFAVWVLRDTILDIIPQVSNKSHSILQLDVQSLIINGRPLALDRFRLALTLITALA